MESNHRPLDRHSGTLSTRPPLPKNKDYFSVYVSINILFVLLAACSLIDGVTAAVENSCCLSCSFVAHSFWDCDTSAAETPGGLSCFRYIDRPRRR